MKPRLNLVPIFCGQFGVPYRRYETVGLNVGAQGEARGERRRRRRGTRRSVNRWRRKILQSLNVLCTVLCGACIDTSVFPWEYAKMNLLINTHPQ